MTSTPQNGRTRRYAARVLAGALAGGLSWASDIRNPDPARIRLVVSEALVGGEVNGRDARLALRTWTEVLAREAAMAVEYDQGTTLRSTPELLQSIAAGRVDACALTTAEYVKVARYIDPETLIVDQAYVDPGEKYLVLVNEDLGARKLEDLRGRNLIVQKGVPALLAAPWLDTLLAESGLGPAASFFGRVSALAKVSQVVLPVYFRQSDCCVVTSRGFALMAELNPQLSRKLRTVAASQPIVTSFLAFHRDCPAARKSRFVSAVLALYKTSYGQQALTLFQCRRLVAQNASILRSSLDVLAASERLRKPGIQRGSG